LEPMATATGVPSEPTGTEIAQHGVLPAVAIAFCIISIVHSGDLMTKSVPWLPAAVATIACCISSPRRRHRLLKHLHRLLHQLLAENRDKTEILVKSLKDKDTQTKELGLREDVKLRDGLAARLTQRCQKCGDPIQVGDRIDNFSRGWCHQTCRFRDVV
jgi:hypothetical protein